MSALKSFKLVFAVISVLKSMHLVTSSVSSHLTWRSGGGVCFFGQEFVSEANLN
jgi:hypothetical protein